MRVRWLKDSEVKAGSKTELQAAKMSVQKWYTYGHCSKKGLLAHEYSMSCGLCRYNYMSCSMCVLHEHYGGCGSGSTYSAADDLLDDFERKPTQTNFIKFQKKARKLWRELLKCVEILENKNG